MKRLLPLNILFAFVFSSPAWATSITATVNGGQPVSVKSYNGGGSAGNNSGGNNSNQHGKINPVVIVFALPCAGLNSVILKVNQAGAVQNVTISESSSSGHVSTLSVENPTTLSVQNAHANACTITLKPEKLIMSTSGAN